jgi:hypothetical protein
LRGGAAAEASRAAIKGTGLLRPSLHPGLAMTPQSDKLAENAR